MNQIVVNNLLLSYSKLGDETESKTTLLFLHGWRSNKEVWGDVMKLLGEECFEAAVDLPGFGASQMPKNILNLDDYSNAVAEFIKKLELKNVCLIGHSFGGRIGIKLAATQPELIQKLVLIDSAGFALNKNKKQIFSLAAKAVKPLFKPKFMQGLRKKIYVGIGAEDYIATPELQKTFVNIVNEDLSEHLPQIKQPTLIVWGDQDLDTPLEFARKMEAQITGAQLVVLPGAGHFSFLDKPDDFVYLLHNFINR